MSRTTFRPYPQEQLPKGFQYPKSYLMLSNNLTSIAHIEGFPWWFEDAEDNLVDLMKVYEELTDLNYLIEFARDGDWVAFFDATDLSGNPRVIVIDLGNKANRYEMNCFDTWLEFVVQNA